MTKSESVTKSWLRAVDYHNAILLGAILVHADGVPYDGKPFKAGPKNKVRA